jgi:hypothetical protein
MVGYHLCYQTNDGRRGDFRIIALSPSSTRTLTIEPPITAIATNG